VICTENKTHVFWLQLCVVGCKEVATVVCYRLLCMLVNTQQFYELLMVNVSLSVSDQKPEFGC
jgi:hypothetical protein